MEMGGFFAKKKHRGGPLQLAAEEYRVGLKDFSYPKRVISRNQT